MAEVQAGRHRPPRPAAIPADRHSDRSTAGAARPPATRHAARATAAPAAQAGCACRTSATAFRDRPSRAP
ncbi:hypothetical protein G6F62_015601 [Rhizopus arrhizus]|nr:hypothetical protein G6F62_015601 [Rhizopus arrhizus]